MNEKKAKQVAEQRIKTMITPNKIKSWQDKIKYRLDPVFDGSQNVNILPVSDSPKTEVIADICRQASGVATGLYLEDLITLCNPKFQRSPNGSGHDIYIPKSVGVDIKMSTETVKKGDKIGSSKKLKEKCTAFSECYFIEFFGKPNSRKIEGVMWYSGADGHRNLGLTEEHVYWITKKVNDFRKKSYQEIKDALNI